MNLTEQKTNGINQIHLTDSLNASLMKLVVKNLDISGSNDLIIYVDREALGNETTERKQYVFNLSSPLRIFNEIKDEFILMPEIVDNKVSMKAMVKRQIGENESGLYLLESPILENLDYSSIALFEGENYIYTNYSNVEMEIIYPKDDEMNRIFLNNSIYSENKDNNEFNEKYYRQAFTKIGDKLNLEVDNINIECITSKNNKFSLDENGNLMVNSISFNGEQSDYGIFNLVYPVGSIYTSVNPTNPSTFFGGTWEAFGTGRTLVGIDENDSNFNTVEKTGGSKNNSTTYTPVGTNTGTSLSVAQLPSHNHSLSISGNTGDAGSHTHRVSKRTSTYGQGIQSGWRAITAPASANGDYNQDSNTESAGTHKHSFGWSGNTNNSGSGNTHTHTFTGTQATINISSLQPYITVYMWKRVA